ncbi:MAG: FAD-binding oxidoreductase [Alphaproteobacteria bacterium]|nr:MAG: FAD-binding oxidoreductase [Alphaproteobacteria bacterium]
MSGRIAPPSDEALTALKWAAGAGGWSEDRAEIAPHLVEWRGRWHGRTPLLLKPADTDSVSAIMKTATRHRVAIVPQGGNTGLVGGGVPDESGAEVLLSLKRMRRIRRLDVADRLIIAEAGATLAEVDEAAAEAGLRFPLEISSGGTASIGGAVATNAGGVHVMRFGSMRALVLGLEMVLADGTVVDELRRVRKDNAGLSLTPLIVGSEGTLAIVTAASLALAPRPATCATAWCALARIEDAIALLRRLETAFGMALEAVELVPEFGLKLVCRHIPGTRAPFAQPYPWHLLAEATSPHETASLSVEMEAALALAMEEGLVKDAVIAKNGREREDLWRLRHAMSEAQKKEGPSIKHDIAVPLVELPAFLKAAEEAVKRRLPGARPCPFGHLGDGNLHFNISAPAGADESAGRDFLARWEEVQRIVHDIVATHGGSFAAEHGIGRLKRGELARLANPGRLAAMRAMKRALDPLGILNPGVML